jgi:hypothetical protein
MYLGQKETVSGLIKVGELLNLIVPLKIHTFSHGGNFCCPEKEGRKIWDTKLFGTSSY